MVQATWREFTHGLSEEDLALLGAYREIAAAFPTTKKVVTHRFTIHSRDELEAVADLIREAHETVGPGTS
ncbi:hypothetical protein [Leifsonia sp. NPDC058230]|uniref:hypothetical protein n=1 Tax=Leifsonia sp. NPDC058230 TaxID=3346391 RepID=UPI0036D8FB40